MQGTQVRSLVGELRSHMTWDTARATQLLSPCTSTRERKSARHNSREARVPQRRAGMSQQKIPHAATKIPRATTMTQGSQKKKVKPIQKVIPIKNGNYWDFPGGPLVKTLRSHRRGHRFDPWSGN